MRKAALGLAAVAAALALMRQAPAGRVVVLPAGVLVLRAGMAVEGGTEVRGARAGTVLRLAGDFSGRAAIVVRGDGVRLHDFTIEGNRDVRDVRAGLPPSDVPFARFTSGNGILAEGVRGLAIDHMRFRGVSGFAVLASRCRDVAIDRLEVRDSGSRNPAGRNNTTGGILMEEGTTGFRVTGSRFTNIRGNGVWTHSLYTSPRNARGLFAGNQFDTVGRDALQVGHATAVRVTENSGQRIGYPAEDVDVENQAVPAGMDTAGNVDGSAYDGNRFEDINGKCIDLDGFHDGEVRGNVCRNLANFGIVMNNSNPDMQSRNIRVEDNIIERTAYGAVFVIGTGHRIVRNRLLGLERALPPGAPDILRSGIYLGDRAERPDAARGNAIEDNLITGWEMAVRCIGRAPGVLPEWNTVRGNVCRN